MENAILPAVHGAANDELAGLLDRLRFLVREEALLRTAGGEHRRLEAIRRETERLRWRLAATARRSAARLS